MSFDTLLSLFSTICVSSSKGVYCIRGLINYKDTKTKCHLIFTGVLIEFIDWKKAEIQSFTLVFSTQLCELPKVKVVYTDCVWLGGGGRVFCVGDHILQEFNTLYLTRFTTYKIALTTPNKNLGGEGASDL
jgi:hypothetical protein